MALIKDSIFGAMLPKVDVELLPANAAQLAQNLKHTSGALDSWKLPAVVSGVTVPGSSAIKTIYRFGRETASKISYWFQFADDVNIIKGPINTDTEERTYWTDGSYPKKTRSSLAGLTAGVAITPASYRMGVPSPGWAGQDAALTFTPVATVTGTAIDLTSTTITSTYVITYVSAWNEESAPGNASNIVTWRAGQTVNITCPGALGGEYNIDRIRLYRSNTGTSSTSFQFAVEKSVGSTTHADNLTGDALGEACPTFDFNPPSDGMIGLTDLGNGIFAGFEKNTVSFCEPEYPYAWPAKYDTTVSAPIVGMKAFGQTLVVGTTEGMVLMTVVDPASVSQDSPKGSQACVSKRSMVEMMGGVVYASPDGLIYVGPSGVKNLTADILSRDEWQAYVPSSIDGYTIDDRYYAFYNTGSVTAGLIFSFGGDAGMVKCDQYVTAGFNELRTDSLYVIQSSAGTNYLKEWNTGSAMTAIWRSKEHRFHSGAGLARAKVTAAAYPLTFTLYGDGVQKYTKTVNDCLPFALPDGKCFTYSYAITTSNKVTSVRMASSMRELGDE